MRISMIVYVEEKQIWVFGELVREQDEDDKEWMIPLKIWLHVSFFSFHPYIKVAYWFTCPFIMGAPYSVCGPYLFFYINSSY